MTAENFQLNAGTTLTIDLELFEDDAMQIPSSDLDGATASIHLRRSLKDVTPALAKEGVLNPELGTVQFTLEDEETITLVSKGELKAIYEYGIKLYYVDGTTQSILQGRIIVDAARVY